MQTSSQRYEATRLAYLRALGVTSWLPLADKINSVHGPVFSSTNSQVLSSTQSVASSTSQLPDSQSSQSHLLQTSSSLEEAQENVDTVQAEPLSKPVFKSMPQSIGQLLVDAPADVVEDIKTIASVSDQTSAHNHTEDLDQAITPIRLSLCWYAPNVLVINEIPVQDGAAMSSSIAQLQTSIVNALGFGTQQIMPKSQIEFYWPLVPGPHGDRSLSGGQQALLYQLKRLLINKEVACVLLLGQRSEQLLPQINNLAFGSVVSVTNNFSEQSGQGDVKLLLSYSLHQLLAQPTLKVEVWQQMQGLLPTSK